MPKRPSAIVLTPDESSILCGDKFGDVYSLPLTNDADKGAFESNSKLDLLSNDEAELLPKPFKPAASLQTVHTKKNQEALKNQQRFPRNPTKSRTTSFENKLLLGHVSLLTDLTCVSLAGKTPGLAQSKTYILTSDRDEHIRVSRGIPQAHVIEGYCLGHTEFVSKLCVPSWEEDLLISGGGDDFLLTWNWVSGEMREKIDLRSHIDDFKGQLASQNHITESLMAGDDRNEEVNQNSGSTAVSGIWALKAPKTAGEDCRGQIIVSCEG